MHSKRGLTEECCEYHTQSIAPTSQLINPTSGLHEALVRERWRTTIRAIETWTHHTLSRVSKQREILMYILTKLYFAKNSHKQSSAVVKYGYFGR